MSRIVENVGCISEIDRFSLETGYARAVRIRVEFLQSKPLLPSLWIPLLSREAVWIEI